MISDDPQPEYLLQISPTFELEYYSLTDDLLDPEALLYHPGRQSLIVLDEGNFNAGEAPRLFEFALDRLGNPIDDDGEVLLLNTQSLPFNSWLDSDNGYESLSMSPDRSRLYVGEEDSGEIHIFDFFNGVAGSLIRTIETGVDDLSGLATLAYGDNDFMLASLHGRSAYVDGVRLGDGRSYLQILDPFTGQRIAEQFVVGDFRTLEGLVINEDRSDVKSFDLYFVHDGGSSDDGLLIGADGHDPYVSLFDPFSTERDSFLSLIHI